MSIINTTPHAIRLPGLYIPPSGDVVRVAGTYGDAGTHDGVSLVRGTYGDVTGLPPEQDGVLYVVSAIVRLQHLEEKIKSMTSERDRYRVALESIIADEEGQSVQSYGLGDIAREALHSPENVQGMARRDGRPPCEDGLSPSPSPSC